MMRTKRGKQRTCCEESQISPTNRSRLSSSRLSGFYDAESYHQKYALRRHSKLLSGLKLSDKDVIDEPIAARLNGYLNGCGSLAEFEKESDKLKLKEDLVHYLRSAIVNAVRHC